MTVQAMIGSIRRLGGVALDTLLPPRCLSCSTIVPSQGTLCGECFRGVTLIGSPLCHRCGVPFLHGGQGVPSGEGAELHCPRCALRSPEYGQARAAYLYDAGSRRLVLPLKYGDRTELAGPIARQMAHAGRELLERADFLVPVPLHRRRLLARRYNQAALLAWKLSRLSGVPCAPDLLRRRRATQPLNKMGAAERAAVLEGAFRLAPGAVAKLQARHVLLVDDVLTSGATVTACARLLLGAGAARVDVLAAARVPDPSLADGADLPSFRNALDHDATADDV
ncbi:comF family protein [Acetobacteraceae bacterium AT-5844]|nr:comF family protein [Acetobacteraceae bacterium AT-5844]